MEERVGLFVLNATKFVCFAPQCEAGTQVCNGLSVERSTVQLSTRMHKNLVRANSTKMSSPYADSLRSVGRLNSRVTVQVGNRHQVK